MVFTENTRQCSAFYPRKERALFFVAGSPTVPRHTGPPPRRAQHCLSWIDRRCNSSASTSVAHLGQSQANVAPVTSAYATPSTEYVSVNRVLLPHQTQL